jgi:hypothetical protein
MPGCDRRRVVVIVVRLSMPARGPVELRGVAELVGGARAAFKNEAELAAFLHHCLSIRAGRDDRV